MINGIETSIKGNLRRPPMGNLLLGVSTLLAIGVAGCGAFSSGFTALIDPSGVTSGATLGNPPGHLVITLVNNAEVDERLLTYLQTQGLVIPPEELGSIRPRIRFRVRVTYVDGQEAEVELVSGSRELVDPEFDSTTEPDLNSNDLFNFVVICDVARVEVVQPVEVFVPVELQTVQFVEPTGTEQGFFRPVGEIPPQFQALLTDLVDDDLNTILQRNIGIRDQAAPADTPRCGAVVGIVVSGSLSVPFLGTGIPGFDLADPQSAASVGGRYEFRVTVQ